MERDPETEKVNDGDSEWQNTVDLLADLLKKNVSKMSIKRPFPKIPPISANLRRKLI